VAANSESDKYSKWSEQRNKMVWRQWLQMKKKQWHS
jgi:hypothetical protein